MINRLFKNWSNLILLISVGLIFYFFIKNFKEKRNYQTDFVISSEKNKHLSDTVLRNKFEIYYLNKLIGIANNNKTIPDSVSAYSMKDGKKAKRINLNALLNTPKSKLIIRYTEIGCNACSDSTFRFIKKAPDLLKKYEVYTLVDFSDYMAYLKWRKFSEVPGTVLWVKKGSLPFNAEKNGETYIFTVNQSKIPGAFFVPNSMFSLYIKNYFISLLN
jgi:hypothetical protein